MVGGCKGERSGDELGDGSGALSLQLVATKSEEHDEGATISRLLFTGERENSAARVSPGSLQEAGNNNMFLLTKIVPDHKYLSRLLKYENNPLIL